MMDQLLTSGLSVKDALEITAIINKNKSDDIASNILKKIQKGTSFAQAINDMPSTFSSVYRGIISVGDKIGSVEKIFPRLRLYLETQKKIRDKIISSLTYPIMVLITSLFVFIIMLFFVFPKLKIMFIEFGGNAAEQLENNINKMENIFLIILIFIISLIFFFNIINYLSKRNWTIKFAKDSFLLKIPIVGKFIDYFETLNFSFAMETLISGGVTIENALLEAKSVLSNERYKKSLENIRNRIIKGESLSISFSTENTFPDYMTKWLYIGEKSGNSEQIFSQIRGYYQNEINLFMSKFMALIEPFLILLIGLFLIILIITIIVPIFSLYSSIL